MLFKFIDGCVRSFRSNSVQLVNLAKFLVKSSCKGIEWNGMEWKRHKFGHFNLQCINIYMGIFSVLSPIYRSCLWTELISSFVLLEMLVLHISSISKIWVPSSVAHTANVCTKIGKIKINAHYVLNFEALKTYSFMFRTVQKLFIFRLAHRPCCVVVTGDGIVVVRSIRDGIN